MQNQPCYDKNGKPIGWLSRSIAVAIFIYVVDSKGRHYIIGSERGEEAADFQGYWNCVCGYLDYNETTKEAAVRECREEIGLALDPQKTVFVGYEDSPKANKQNVTFRFAYVINCKSIDEIRFSRKGNEGKEVGKIACIEIRDIDKYKWAFNHGKIAKKIWQKIMLT